MSFDVAAIRAQFPILVRPPGGESLHYLDSAASAQIPQAVIDAVVRHETTARANVLRGVHRLAEAATEAYENARAQSAAFLNAEAQDVVFTGGCTAAINLVADSFCRGLARGDEIVISELEHHSNIVPWQMAAERNGLTVKAIPATLDGRLELGALDRLVSKRTRMIAITHASNVTGAVTDLGAIVGAAKSVGAHVLVDGAQRAPHGPIDVPALGVDFYAFAGHKAYGPNGVGVLWGRRAALAALPPYMGGGSMIAQVSIDKTTFAPPPRRFEAGTPPIAQAVGLGAALAWMAGLDWQAVTAHEMRLTQRLMDGLGSRRGVKIWGPSGLQHRVPVVSFTVDGVHPHDVSQILDEAGVAVRGGHHCAQPLMQRFGLAGTTRASIAPYSDDGDIAALLEGVALAQKRLA